jgi:hypothetical protein
MNGKKKELATIRGANGIRNSAPSATPLAIRLAMPLSCIMPVTIAYLERFSMVRYTLK